MVTAQQHTLSHETMYICTCLHFTWMHIIRVTHIMHYYVCILHMSISLHPPSFDVKGHLLHSYGLKYDTLELTTYECTWFVSDCVTDALYLAVKQIFIMDLVIYDAHNVHYHMNPLQLVTLSGYYFTHLDYLAMHCWIWATLLHTTYITATGASSVWRYVQLFERVVGHMPNGAPSTTLF